MADSDLQSKINRAVRALLINSGAGSALDTFTELTSDTRAIPNTTIATGSGDELVKFTGLWKFPGLTVSMRDNAAVEADEANPNAAWIAALTRYNDVRTALSLIGDAGELNYTAGQITSAGRALAESDLTEEGDIIAADNADMANFTVTWWAITGLSSPRLNSENNCFESELQFECHACNGNIS